MVSSTAGSVTEPYVDWDYVEKLENADKWLRVCAIGSVIVFGVVGNILAIITLRARPFRMFQSTFLLIALACSDIGVLCTNALFEWIGPATEVNIAMASRVICKLGPFGGSLAVTMSAWTLVLITLERMVSVLRPDKLHLFSAKRIHITWSIMVGILILFQLYILILFDHHKFAEDDPETNTTRYEEDCDYNPNHDVDQIEEYNFWSDLFLASAIPCLLIFTFNAIIIKRLAGPFRLFSDRAVIPQPTKKHSSTTVMLVVVSIVFLITTLPVRIYQVGYREWWEDLEEDPIQENKDHLMYSCLSCLYYINNAVNFILYMVVNPMFRRAFVCVFCCKKHEEDLDEEAIGQPIATDHVLKETDYGSGTTTLSN